ncbi:MAG TPA: hypothetical protein VEO92_08155, partial [Candidatus Nitrosocosmicus sp.]|nr:hypothetical protein [Candidatus Nitrosocosmicus sp.]
PFLSPHSIFAWFYIEVPENPAGTHVSNPQIHDGTTIETMQDILNLLTASAQSPEELDSRSFELRDDTSPT